MAAPTLVASYLPTGTTGGTGNWSDATTPKTVSVTVAAGDLLVTLAAAEDAASVVGTPTGGTSVTWTQLATAGVANSLSRATVWSTSPEAQTFTESVARTSGSQHYSFVTARISGATGTGTPVTTTSGGSAPSLSITTTQANSGILLIVADWAAVTGTSYTYRQVNGANPTEIVAGAGTAGSDYRVWVLWYPDAGAAGAKTVGMTVPSGQTPTMIAVEVKGSSSASPNVTAVVSTGSGSSPAPVVSGTRTASVTAVAPTASGSAAAPTTSITAGVAVTAVVATATSAAGTPRTSYGVVLPWSTPKSVDTTTSVSVTAVVATGSALAGTPTVTVTSGSVTVTAVVATASASAAAPGTAAHTVNGPWSLPAQVSTVVSSVTAVVSTASAAAGIPAVVGEQAVTGGGPATATALAKPPTATGSSTPVGSTVTAVRALSTALAKAPAYTSGASLVAVRATANSLVRVPVVSGTQAGTYVQSVMIDGTEVTGAWSVMIGGVETAVASISVMSNGTETVLL